MKKYAKIIKAPSVSAQGDDLELINGYTRRNFTQDEVYVFSVALCDNEVDRDFERFPLEALKGLEKLFLGKPGIFDHNPTAENQAARIFHTEIEAVSGEKNSLGQDYYRLVARAYMPKSEKNRDLILAIDSGICKEVSVGCSVKRSVCSICGSERGRCEHIGGKSYSGKLCCFELCEPYDAYEWSFVAVPSQRRAGVIKSFEENFTEENMDEILKSIENGSPISLSGDDSRRLGEYISSLKSSAAHGALYRNELSAEVKRYSSLLETGVSPQVLESVIKKMSIEELKEYRRAYGERVKDLGGAPQLAKHRDRQGAGSKNEFMI